MLSNIFLSFMCFSLSAGPPKRCGYEHNQDARMQTFLFPGIEDRCCVCGLAIEALLTNAHLHGSHRTVRLCWTCHRAYDIDILTTEEVLTAETAARRGNQTLDVSALHRGWERDLQSGKRRIDKRRQHG